VGDDRDDVDHLLKAGRARDTMPLMAAQKASHHPPSLVRVQKVWQRDGFETALQLGQCARWAVGEASVHTMGLRNVRPNASEMQI
jgi:hypothetical protein